MVVFEVFAHAWRSLRNYYGPGGGEAGFKDPGEKEFRGL